MARINVKVPTARIIKALETRLETNVTAITENERKRKSHKIALDKHNKSILKDYAKDLELEEVSQRWNGRLQVEYKIAEGVELPKSPELILDKELGNYEIDEIQNAIRVLKMTEDEVVSTSTFNSVSQYL
jgi:hypothetical protein